MTRDYIRHATTPHAIGGWEKVIGTAFFKQSYYFIFNFLFGGESHTRRIAYRLDFVKDTKNPTLGGVVLAR
jgi:hypothetical protein